MADNDQKSNAKSFIIGALVIIVAGLGYFVWSGGDLPQQQDAEITIDLPDGN